MKTSIKPGIRGGIIKVFALVSLFVFMFTFISCNLITPPRENGETTKKSDETTAPEEPFFSDAELLEAFEMSYPEAERIYSMFTGAGRIKSTGDEAVNLYGERYIRVAEPASLAELETLVNKYFSREIASSLMNKKVGPAPLFTDYNGGLHIFGGYVGLWGYDAAENEKYEIINNEGNTAVIRVYADNAEWQRTFFGSYDYPVKISEDKEIIFTDFKLMSEVLYKIFADADSQVPEETNRDEIIKRINTFVPEEAEELICYGEIPNSNVYLLSYRTEPESVCVYYTKNTGKIYIPLVLQIPAEIEYDSARAVGFFRGAGSGEAAIIVRLQRDDGYVYVTFDNYAFTDESNWLDFKYGGELPQDMHYLISEE